MMEKSEIMDVSEWEIYWKDQNKNLEIFFDYLLIEKGLSQSTIFSYKRDIKLLCIYLYNSDWFKINIYPSKRRKDSSSLINKVLKKGNLFLIRYLKQDILRDFFYQLEENDFKSSSRARIHSSLMQYYNFELKLGNIVNNPLEFVEKPNINRNLPNILTEEDIDKLLSYIRKGASKSDSLAKKRKKIKIKCLIEILYSTGLRVSELINLKVQDINITKRTLVVFGKGGKERNAYFTTKAAKSIKSWLEINPQIENYLFPSHGVSGHITRDSINKILAEVSVQLGFKKSQLSPHKLRHAFATHMLTKGADIRVIQQLLWHSNISTTEIYTHILDTETLDKVIKNHPLGKSHG